MPENETVCIVTGRICPKDCPAHEATNFLLTEIKSRLAEKDKSGIDKLTPQQLSEQVILLMSQRSRTMTEKICVLKAEEDEKLTLKPSE